MNRLYFGDNLTVLREHISDESVDLVYLDPPFNSKATYNVLFKSAGGSKSQAQAEAFRDTWAWGEAAEAAYDDIRSGGGNLALVMTGLRRSLGENAMMAYLAMMGVRLVELHRALKPTGSLYLHCDPTASHYLKVLLDGIFGYDAFCNEIVWKRTSSKSDYSQGAKHFPKVHDSILLFRKSAQAKFKPVFLALDEDYARTKYPHLDEQGRRYGLWDMTGPGGAAKGNPFYEVMGVGRHWRYSQARMERMIAEGLVVQTKPGGVPREKRLLGDSFGVAVGDVWTDIPPVNSQARERLGYPTQKPIALLKRLIAATSNDGDLILDPFCGCGTTIDAAEELGRQWVGIDVTHYAITLIERRIQSKYPQAAYAVLGRPTDLAGARDLARRDKHQFQWWAAWRLGAQRYREEKKGADRGVDGRAHFKNGPYGDGLVIISVKGGDNLSVAMVRDLRGVIEREEAEMGVLVTLAEPTGPMLSEAAAAGFVRQSAHGRLPRIQIATIADILDGRLPKLPPLPSEEGRHVAPSRRRRDPNQLELLLPLEGSKQSVAKGEFVDPRYLNLGAG